MWVPALAGPGGLKPVPTNDWGNFHASSGFGSLISGNSHRELMRIGARSQS